MKLLKMYLILLMFDYNIPTRRKVERERAQTTELKKKKKQRVEEDGVIQIKAGCDKKEKMGQV